MGWAVAVRQAQAVRILDAGGFVDIGQFSFIEVRIAARTGKTSHIDQGFDLMGLKNLDELFSGARGVADGPDCGQSPIVS